MQTQTHSLFLFSFIRITQPLFLSLFLLALTNFPYSPFLLFLLSLPPTFLLFRLKRDMHVGLQDIYNKPPTPPTQPTRTYKWYKSISIICLFVHIRHNWLMSAFIKHNHVHW